MPPGDEASAGIYRDFAIKVSGSAFRERSPLPLWIKPHLFSLIKFSKGRCIVDLDHIDILGPKPDLLIGSYGSTFTDVASPDT